VPLLAAEAPRVYMGAGGTTKRNPSSVSARAIGDTMVNSFTESRKASLSVRLATDRGHPTILYHQSRVLIKTTVRLVNLCPSISDRTMASTAPAYNNGGLVVVATQPRQHCRLPATRHTSANNRLLFKIRAADAWAARLDEARDRQSRRSGSGQSRVQGGCQLRPVRRGSRASVQRGKKFHST
jgi:hypothetical protein